MAVAKGDLAISQILSFLGAIGGPRCRRGTPPCVPSGLVRFGATRGVAPTLSFALLSVSRPVRGPGFDVEMFVRTYLPPWVPDGPFAFVARTPAYYVRH